MRPGPPLLLAAGIAILGGTVFAQTIMPFEASAARGQALVARNCSGCHATGAEGASPHPQAPAFRSLGERFPIDALEETFIDSIDTGHPGMPVFQATPQQIADIIEYIATVMEQP